MEIIDNDAKMLSARCSVCNDVLPRGRYRAKTCTKKSCVVTCRENKRMEIFGKTATCRHCSKQFITKNYNQTFCSPECRTVNWKTAHNNEKSADFNIFKRDEFRCIYCGKSSIEDGVKLNVDHLVPMNSGGDFSFSNLVTSCQDCNLRKGRVPFSDIIVKRVLAITNCRNEKLNEENINDLKKEVKILIQSRQNAS